MEMLGLVLFYVGAVLIINGLTLLDKINPREAAIMNLFTGFVSLSVCLYSAFVLATPEAIRGAALGLLFGFTYLWVAYNNLNGHDGRGLGWFSLFVAITTIPVFLMEWAGVNSLGTQWLALNWAAWGLLWFSFFLLCVVKPELKKPVGIFAIVQGILTGWVPGFLLFTQQMPFN